jgi:hypothetical protein
MKGTVLVLSFSLVMIAVVHTVNILYFRLKKRTILYKHLKRGTLGYKKFAKLSSSWGIAIAFAVLALTSVNLWLVVHELSKVDKDVGGLVMFGSTAAAILLYVIFRSIQDKEDARKK